VSERLNGRGDPLTIVLSASVARQALDLAQLTEWLRAGFIDCSGRTGPPAGRFIVPVPHEGASSVALMPGLIPGIPAFTVKVNSKFPDHRPAIQGVVLLFDLDAGDLLAVMDSAHLTAVRTGEAAALAAKTLARSDADSAAVIGAGALGRSQLRGLQRQRTLRRVSVFDVDARAAERFATEMSLECGIQVARASSLDEAVRGAGIVAIATWATRPFFERHHLEPGMHITTLGPDAPGKCEVGADAIRAAKVVVDRRELALSVGAIRGAGCGPETIRSELGEVLAGRATGRESSDEITLFAGVGLPFQDLAIAWPIYLHARRTGIGTVIEFRD
jgi:ornithine cyclodeaminase/alanine dehydrogenase-like protein (mu-crystallin family)